MKKLLLILMIFILPSLCFAISDITLFGGNELLFSITDNVVYDGDGEFLGKIIGKNIVSENDSSKQVVGNISEDNKYLIINIIEEDDVNNCLMKFNKENGYLVYYQEDNEVIYCYEDTGLIKNGIYYYDDGKICSTAEMIYDENKNRIQIIECEYDEDGNILTKSICDGETEQEIERHIFNDKSTEPTIISFFKFEEDKNYDIGDDFYVNNSISQWKIDYQKFFRWDDSYYAEVKKVKFDESFSGYACLKEFDKNNFINQFITVGDKNSKIYYCFEHTDDFKIDFSNCYEIHLIEKSIAFLTMNKSGKGSGPFGFSIGMTYDEVKAACNGVEPEHIRDDRYYVKPIKSHPLFEKYVIWISKKYGVYYVKGISDSIQTSEDGTEVIQKFDNILYVLEKKYGKFQMVDSIKSDYPNKEKDKWMESIKDGARTYRAYWESYYYETDDISFDGLDGIIIGIDNMYKYSSTDAYIWIEYEFENYTDSKALLDDVL